MKNLRIENHGSFKYTADTIETSCCFSLYLIKKAWEKGANFEKLADGFGAGLGTMGGDWSGIRDSSDEATSAMLEKALKHLGLED